MPAESCASQCRVCSVHQLFKSILQFFVCLFFFLLKHFASVWVRLIVKPELYRISDFSLMNHVTHQLSIFLIVSKL